MTSRSTGQLVNIKLAVKSFDPRNVELDEARNHLKDWDEYEGLDHVDRVWLACKNAMPMGTRSNRAHGHALGLNSDVVFSDKPVQRVSTSQAPRLDTLGNGFQAATNELRAQLTAQKPDTSKSLAEIRQLAINSKSYPSSYGHNLASSAFNTAEDTLSSGPSKSQISGGSMGYRMSDTGRGTRPGSLTDKSGRATNNGANPGTQPTLRLQTDRPRSEAGCLGPLGRPEETEVPIAQCRLSMSNADLLPQLGPTVRSSQSHTSLTGATSGPGSGADSAADALLRGLSSGLTPEQWEARRKRQELRQNQPVKQAGSTLQPSRTSQSNIRKVFAQQPAGMPKLCQPVGMVSPAAAPQAEVAGSQRGISGEAAGRPTSGGYGGESGEYGQGEDVLGSAEDLPSPPLITSPSGTEGFARRHGMVMRARSVSDPGKGLLLDIGALEGVKLPPLSKLGCSNGNSTGEWRK